MDHEKRQRIIFIDSPRPNAYALDEAYTGCLLKLIADNRSLLVNRGGGGLRRGTRSQTRIFLFSLLLLLFLLLLLLLLFLLSLSKNSSDRLRG